ncbi:hypothetical protein A3F37_03670 [Candidatus Saccharibacteria bacterium RIFCSPHIGHO2_12_FULL_41_12]|nr:MAG: hypothetical protein A3F37_03670 [Candidatus Saccharibacteria bacterium RIFCSPHIGHO2_12_FULL_41_12]
MAPIKKFIRKIFPRKLAEGLADTFRLGRGWFWRAYYGFPARSLQVIAVTGTNGKTTTVSFINEVLKSAGFKTAVWTTAYTETAGDHIPSPTTVTLQHQSALQKFLALAKKKNVDWVVLEVPSHALDQRRIEGVRVEVAVVTNLTPEHLDYHGTMEEYARVKSLLLRDYDAKWAVLNADDKYFDYFSKRSKAEVFSFGKKTGASGVMKSINLSGAGSNEHFAAESGTLDVKTSLLGEFNLYNASAAVSVGLVLGLDSKKITEGIANLKAVAGRMEAVDAGQNFTVLIDYAVTPDALENVLKTLQQIAKGSVRIVFGATGDRDKAKRPLMGEVVVKSADFIYLTDDETYTEDPSAIRDAVYTGIEKAGGASKTKVIADRKQAIKTAFAESRQGDIVLLAGMGHEDHRNLGGKQVPWKESEIARELLS